MDTPSDFERDAMREAVAQARAAVCEPGKAGIAAAVLRDGKIVATGTNHVERDTDPAQHAEIVALGRATAALGRADLGDCVLISTLQPCEMCLAAARFAGVRRIIFAARKENVAAKYFVFPHLTLGDFQGTPPAFAIIGGVMEDDVLDLYEGGQE